MFILIFYVLHWSPKYSILYITNLFLNNIYFLKWKHAQQYIVIHIYIWHYNINLCISKNIAYEGAPLRGLKRFFFFNQLQIYVH